MKSHSLALLAALFATLPLPAQDTKTESASELEGKFKAALTGVTFAGRSSTLKDGALGPEKPDNYVIERAEKISGDDWLIHAVFKTKKGDLVLPVPVKVKWAGDTAVIVVDRMQLPGGAYGGTAYSARVLIHDGTYAGTWSGGDHGGVINGVITKTKP